MVVFTPKGHTENTKLMKKIPLNSNNGLSYTWMTVVSQLCFNSRDKVGVLVCWCWRLRREVPSADSSRIQSPRAQVAPAAERSQTPLWNRSWCTGILFSQHYRPQQQQHHLQSSPSEWERSSEAAFQKDSCKTLCFIYLLLHSESPTPSILFLPAPIATSLLLPNQAFCRFYQHPLNKSPTMDITRFPFIASSTLCSPNALDCKNEGRMGSLYDNLRFHMLGASWYLSAAKTDGASQEAHCETKAEPWAATNMCQDPGSSITDRCDITHREVKLTVAPCQLPPKECHFRVVLSRGSFHSFASFRHWAAHCRQDSKPLSQQF